MQYRRLINTANTERYQTRFGGINLQNGTPLGEWEELHNMNSESYPAVCSSQLRRFRSLPSDMTGFMMRNDSLVYTTADAIIVGDKELKLTLTEGQKKLVSMGAYIVVLPDWIVINTEDMTLVDGTFTDDSTATTITGGRLTEANTNMTSPSVDIHKDLYFLTDASNNEVKKLKEGDTVKVSYAYNGKVKSLVLTVADVSTTESYVEEGQIAVVFDTSGQYSDTYYFFTEGKKMSAGRPYTSFDNVKLEKSAEIQKAEIPGMDYELIVEHNNRLWGCSSDNHEIYCSKLGDPFRWREYSGISTDSYAVTVGSDGDFTGSTVYNDSVLFFKENCVHIVYGTKASNFTLSTIELRGVQKGSYSSICKSNGLLYYKAPEGIFVFNGSTSVRADGRLGSDIKDTAVGVADDNAVYMATDDTVYVYDYLHDNWHTESLDSNTVAMLSGYNYGGALYLVAKANDDFRLYLMRGIDDTMTQTAHSVSFELQTGELNRIGAIMRHISKLRFVVGTDSSYDAVAFDIQISYNGGEFRTVYSFDSKASKPATEIFTVPVIPMRCQRMKLKISGTAENATYTSSSAFTLYGIYYNTEGGTELG